MRTLTNESTGDVYVNTVSGGVATEIASDNSSSTTIDLSFKANTTESTSLNADDLLLIADNSTGKTLKYITSDNFLANATNEWNLDSGNLYPNATSTNVLVGTTTNSNSHKLLVDGNARIITGSTYSMVFNNNGQVTIGNNSTVGHAPAIGGSVIDDNRRGLLVMAGTSDTNSGSDMQFNIRESDVAGGSEFTTLTGSGFEWTRFGSNLMRLTRDGKLGIGTTSPSHKLHVVGDCKITGNLTLDSDIIKGSNTITLPSSVGTLALISDIPTNNNELTNGAGYVTSASIPTDNSQLANGRNYITASSSDTLTNKSLSYSQLTGTPTIPTNNNELMNGAGYVTSASIPTDNSQLANGRNYITASSSDTLTNKSLSYSQLTGTPTIPTDNSQLANGQNYITASSSDVLTNKTLDDADFTGVTKITLNTGDAVLYDQNGTIQIGNNSSVNKAPCLVGIVTNSNIKALQIISGSMDTNSVSDMQFNVRKHDGGDFATGSRTGSGFEWAREGTALMRLTRDGKLGIGNSAPSDQLHVVGSAQITSDLTLGGNIIKGSNTITLPSSTGTLAVTSDIPTNNNQLTNGAGYITASSSDTLTNKTLTSPVANNIKNSNGRDLINYDAATGVMEIMNSTDTCLIYEPTLIYPKIESSNDESKHYNIIPGTLSGSANVRLPDLTGFNEEFILRNASQTLVNKTIHVSVSNSIVNANVRSIVGYNSPSIPTGAAETNEIGNFVDDLNIYSGGAILFKTNGSNDFATFDINNDFKMLRDVDIYGSNSTTNTDSTKNAIGDLYAQDIYAEDVYLESLSYSDTIYVTGAPATGVTNGGFTKRFQMDNRGLYLYQSPWGGSGNATVGRASWLITPGFQQFRLEFHLTGTDGTLSFMSYINGAGEYIDYSFTGQHKSQSVDDAIYNNTGDYVGLICCATGDYATYDFDNEVCYTDSRAIMINDAIPVIELSRKRKDKRVYGVISNKEDTERTMSHGRFYSRLPNSNDVNRVVVNSIGEGGIWVVNTNGSFENGDYIQTSDVAGYGEKQDSEFLANYTVAKITCDCDFDVASTKYVSKTVNGHIACFVGCIYYCG